MSLDGMSRLERLHEIVDERLSGLLGEMTEAGWELHEIVGSIRRAMEARVPERDGALKEASKAVSQDFVSDGNEG